MSIATRERFDSEEGFTLIELLVVVIIIGILAAIAIPTFLSQRERGWQAELTSAVRNAALEVEADATTNGGDYPVTLDGQALVDTFLVSQLGQADASTPVDLTYTATATGFTLVGDHDDLPGTVTYDTAQGGVQNYDETP